MGDFGLHHIEILPAAADPAFAQRETSVAHTTYAQETALFSAIQRGDVEQLRGMLQAPVVVGRLSASSVRQMQYIAVSAITLAVRYAIQGGLDEMTAYNMSDRGILQIDSFTSPRQIEEYLAGLLVELAGLVREQARPGCPAGVRRCLAYIGLHLHEPIRLADLARLANFSEDYLSKLFKKHVGKTVREYILERRLEAARAMLQAGRPQQEVAYTLGFCSQTYFITCFKKAYGVTPRRYAVAYTGQVL